MMEQSAPWYMRYGRHVKDECDPPPGWFRALLQRAAFAHTRLQPCLALLAAHWAAHGIVWWLTGGSLLGALRHGGCPVPHDDDVDVAVWEDDVGRVADVATQLGALCVWRDESLWQGRRFANVTFFDGTPDRVVIDVWPVPRRNTDAHWSCERPSEVEPLVACRFNGVDAFVPQDGRGYLARLYSESWETECVVWGHHDNWSLTTVWRIPLAQYAGLVAACREEEVGANGGAEDLWRHRLSEAQHSISVRCDE